MQFHLLVLMLPFRGLSVCPSVMFVHCAQMAEDMDTTSIVSCFYFREDFSVFAT